MDLAVLFMAAAAPGAPSEAVAGARAIAIAKLDRTAPVDFQRDVLPILRTSCLACHNKTKAKAKLVLETPADIRKGGESGPAVVAGHGSQSLLLKAASHDASVDSPMPPPDNKVNAPDLTSEQLGLISLWIDQGAAGQVRSEAPIVWRQMPRSLRPIYAVAVSPHGQLAACGRANEIIIYHLPDGRAVGPLTDPSLSSSAAAHRDMVESLAFSPDGQFLASGSYREVKIWRRLAPVKRFDLPGGPVAASADGKLLATAEGGTIHLWDAVTGATVGGISTADEATVSAICFSPDGGRLAAVSDGKSLCVWNSRSDQPLARAEADCELNALAWASGGKRLAAACADGVIRLWNVPKMAGEEMIADNVLTGHSGPVTSLAINPAVDRQVLSGGQDGTVRLWNADTGQELRQMRHGAAVAAVAIRPDGKRFASAGADNRVVLWDASDGHRVAEMTGDRRAVDRAAVAARATALAGAQAAYRQARVEQFQKKEKAAAQRLEKAAADAKADDDLELLSALRALAQAARSLSEAKDALASAQAAQKTRNAEAEVLADESVRSRKATRFIAFSPDGGFLATAGDDGAVHTWDAQTGAAIDVFGDAGAAIHSIAFAGPHELALGRGAGAAAWHLSDQWELDRVLGRDAASSPFADRVTALDFSPDGRLLATGGGQPSRQGEIILWDLRGPELLRRFDDVDSDTVFCLRFSPDGHKLAAGSADKFVRIIDLDSATVVRSLEGHTHHVLGVAWKSDGRTLASAGADGTLRVWDCDTGERKKVVTGFDKEVTGVCFLADSDQAVAACESRLRVLHDGGGNVRTLDAGSDFLYCLAATPDGGLIIAAGQDGILRIWNARTGQLTATCGAP